MNRAASRDAGSLDSDAGSIAGSIDSIDDFFLPDLCRVQAIFFLVLVGELLAIVLTVARQELWPFDWNGFALTSLYIQWVVLLSAALLCQSRPRLQQLSLPLAAACSYVLILLVAALAASISQYLLQGRLALDQWQLDWNRFGRDMLICALLAGIILRYFYLMQQLQRKQQAELQSRIEALQSRIRPHFLFNSMNSIASLIAIDPEAAETAVEDLASLFRASLAESRTEFTLAEELALCHCYARIEQLRLGSRLQLRWDLAALDQQLPIPPLSLQPLLENAIYHGIQLRPEGGEVSLQGWMEQRQGSNWVVIEVRNPLPAEAAVDKPGNRMASSNIQHRLQALYGAAAGLSLQQQGQQFVATLQYPLAAGDQGG